MSEPVGIIDGTDPNPATEPSGEPATISNPPAADGNPEPIGEPEIIYGFDPVIEPGTVPISDAGSYTGNTSGRRTKSGRPDGRAKSWETRRAKAEEGDKVVADLSGILYLIHETLVSLTGVQELALDTSEAKELDKAIKKVAKYYPVGLNPKYIAWGELFLLAGNIYGTRVAAWRVRVSAEKKATPIDVKTKDTKPTKQPTNGAPNPMATPSQAWFEPPKDGGEYS